MISQITSNVPLRLSRSFALPESVLLQGGDLRGGCSLEVPTLLLGRFFYYSWGDQMAESRDLCNSAFTWIGDVQYPE